MEKISVLMTVYNASEMLDKSIKAILNQTYTNFEFVIINDGSIDMSGEIIEKYAKEDKRIIFVNRTENKGRVYSLNEGLNLCRGKWIAINDADDVSNIYRLERVAAFITDNNIADKFGIVGSASRTKDIIGGNEKNNYITYGTIGKKRIAKFRLLYSMPFIHSSFVYNIEALHAIEGFPKEVTSLIDFFALVKISNMYPIYGINEILVDRYIDGNNFFLKGEMKPHIQRNMKIIDMWESENYKRYFFFKKVKAILSLLKKKN